MSPKRKKKGNSPLIGGSLWRNGTGSQPVLLIWIRICSAFRLRGEKLEEKSESAAAYLWAEYEMTPSQAETWKEEGYNSPSQVREVIGQLKNQIRAFGNINVNAIEDYREVSERYEFMRDQYEDLVAAREELERIIEELDQGDESSV